MVISGISPRFRGLSQSEGQITHVLLTRSPLVYPRKGLTARLACVKHAASVRPEPGSNSPLKTTQQKNPDKKQTILAIKQPPTQTTQHTSHPRQRQQINSSTFKHTVEFSNITRTPQQNQPAPPRGNPPNLPENHSPVKMLQGPASAFGCPARHGAIQVHREGCRSRSRARPHTPAGPGAPLSERPQEH